MRRKTYKGGFNFVKVAAATPIIKVANPLFNAHETVKLLETAESRNVAVAFFPELGITGYTCADLFHQLELLEGALDGIEIVRKATESKYRGIVYVGAPILQDGVLFNCAVAICQGEVLGVVPKLYLVNNGEFYEWRWFSPGENAFSKTIDINGEIVPFGWEILFECEENPDVVIGLDICEDGWALEPPSTKHAMFGATIIGNLSASPEMVGKADYRRTLFTMRSATCIAAYVYTSAGVHESTTDLVFGGHQFVAENGTLLAENKRFQRDSSMTVVDIDLDRLKADRMRIKNFADSRRRLQNPPTYQRVRFSIGERPTAAKLDRHVAAHPFVPSNPATLNERCEEVFSIQVAGLARRLEQIWRNHEAHCPTRTKDDSQHDHCDCLGLRKDGKAFIGVSGGRDSTLALMAAIRDMDLLGLPRTCIHGITMPGFGTTEGTKRDAVNLMTLVGISIEPEQDIRFACMDEWRRTGHKPFGRIDIAAIYKQAEDEFAEEKRLKEEACEAFVFSFEKFEARTLELFEAQLRKLPRGSQDLVFENTQARHRTEILMNKGFVLGTGDLSELAQGWCTYNADHMSMYNVNGSIPKTLINFLIKWVAENLTEGDLQKTLLSIIAAKISPELLPKGEDGEIAQDTEEAIGPYELTDFFLYYMLRMGYGPEKILYLAKQAKGFDKAYTGAVIEKWLKVFLHRFFNNQFKRSCLPDAPKVGSICVSPRGDWRMPSDADVSMWLAWAERPIQEEKTIEVTTGAKPPNVLRVHLRVDNQDCFMPGGPLGVPGGDEILTPINAVSRSGYHDETIDSQDAHNPGQTSFASNHPGTKHLDEVEMYGFMQRVWNDHGTPKTGQAFHKGLDRSMVTFTVRKGTDDRVDSYSAFYDNGRQATPEIRAQYDFLGKSTGLAEYITAKAEAGGYDEIELDGSGLALGFCVSWSLIDARSQVYRGKKWRVRLIEDATRAIIINDGDYARYIDELKSHGIEIIKSADILTKVAV